MMSARLIRRKPAFKSHQTAHEAVLANPDWFTNSAPVLGKQFTVERATERKLELTALLFGAASRHRQLREDQLADCFEILADKIHACNSRRRCGSLACTHCHRAFQKAKVAAQTVVIEKLKADKIGKALVMVTVVPMHFTFKPDGLATLNVKKLNRWLKDNLTRAHFRRAMMGSIDISWEADRGVYQIHWHIAMWTSNRKKLTRRLKTIFRAKEQGDRPAHAAETYSLNFLPYQNKAIKLPQLLRNNRQGLPHLLLALDRTDPLELMVLFRMRVSAQSDGLKFNEMAKKRK